MISQERYSQVVSRIRYLGNQVGCSDVSTPPVAHLIEIESLCLELIGPGRIGDGFQDLRGLDPETLRDSIRDLAAILDPVPGEANWEVAALYHLCRRLQKCLAGRRGDHTPTQPPGEVLAGHRPVRQSRVASKRLSRTPGFRSSPAGRLPF